MNASQQRTELLAAVVGAPQVLRGLRVAPLLGLELGLELLHLLLELCERLAAALQHARLGLLDAHRELLHLRLELLAQLVHVHRVFLLLAQLVRHARRVRHGRLELVVSRARLGRALLEVRLHRAQVRLELPLRRRERAHLRAHLRRAVRSLAAVRLRRLLRAVRLREHM